MKSLEECSQHSDSLQTGQSRVGILVWGETCGTHRDRPRGPPSLLYNGQQFYLPGVKQPGHGTNHQPPSSTILSTIFSVILTSVTKSIIQQNKMTKRTTTTTTTTTTNTSPTGSESPSCKSHSILHRSVHSTKRFKLSTVLQGLLHISTQK